MISDSSGNPSGGVRTSTGANIAVGLLVFGLAAMAAWLGWRIRHYPVLNDFWPLFIQAGTLDWSNVESFKNGFFPPGYAVFLSLLPGQYVLAQAYYANVAFSVATVMVTYVAARNLAGPAGGFAAATLTALHPLSFALMMTTGPDAGCIFMLWTGFCLLHAAVSAGNSRSRRWSGWIAGVLFAVAILWRYHALVYAVASLAAVFAVTRGRVVWRAAIGVGAALAVLGGLSLFPGFSSQLARAQAFGVWEALHPVNWYHMPTDFPPSIAAVIRAEPEAFLRAYWQFHRPYLWLLAPPVLAALLVRGGGRRFALSLVILQIVYLPVVGVGTSPRGVAPVVPATMLSIGLLIGHVQQWLPRSLPQIARTALPAALVLAVAARSWWRDNRSFIEASIAGYESRSAVELELRAQGVTAPLQVFGDAGFHFVLYPGRGWYSYLPRSNGGWPRLDLYGLDRIAPEIRTDSLDDFVEDCKRNGITHIVLGPTVGALLPDLAQVFTGERAHPSLNQTASVAGFKIFAISHGATSQAPEQQPSNRTDIADTLLSDSVAEWR
jgi:hypothetical protein